MLSAHRTSELQDEVADLFGNGDHAVNAVLALEVDQRSYVKAPDAGVSVVSRLSAVILDDLVKALYELW